MAVGDEPAGAVDGQQNPFDIVVRNELIDRLESPSREGRHDRARDVDDRDLVSARLITRYERLVPACTSADHSCGRGQQDQVQQRGQNEQPEQHARPPAAGPNQLHANERRQLTCGQREIDGAHRDCHIAKDAKILRVNPTVAVRREEAVVIARAGLTIVIIGTTDRR